MTFRSSQEANTQHPVGNNPFKSINMKRTQIFSMPGKELLRRSEIDNLNPKIGSGACAGSIAAQRAGPEVWPLSQSQGLGRLRMISIYITF